MSDILQRPVGYSGSAILIVEFPFEIQVNAYLWGGGGGSGGGGGGAAGIFYRGGNGSGGGYAGTTFTAGPGDTIAIMVGGAGLGGTAGTAIGGLGGSSYVLGSTSYSGGTGGNGASSAGGGGGSGGATVLIKNSVVLAVAGGGGGGGGAGSGADGIDSPGSDQAALGITAGQNGQTRNAGWIGGGGGGAGGGGAPAGNGALLLADSGPGLAGAFGLSLGTVTGAPNGANPGQANNPLRRGAGQGGVNAAYSTVGTPGSAGLAVFEFPYLPGSYIKVNGNWLPIRKTWIKVDGQWKSLNSTYLRLDGQWVETKNSYVPAFVSTAGQFGYAPRSIADQAGPTISYSLIPDTFDPVEGTTLGFTVTTTNFGTGTLYWAMLDPVNTNQLASPTLFVSQRYGTVSVVNNLGRFSVNISSTATGPGKQSVVFRANLSVNDVSAPASGFATGITVANAGPITIQPTLSPPSVISVSWNPISIQVSGSATLSWSTTNATKTDISIPGGNPSFLTNQPASGSVNVAFANAGTFTATVTATSSLGGTDSKSAAISVTSLVQILGSFTGPTFIAENAQDEVNLALIGPDPGTYNYSISSNPTVEFDSSTGNPPNGIFSIPGPTRAAVHLKTPHPDTVVTATISRPGYQPFVQSLRVPSRAAPSGSVEFTRAGTSGIWTVPVGVFRLRVTVVGAGGGGAAGSEKNPWQSGGGGGGSGGLLQFELNVQPFTQVSYYVGRGGGGTGRVGAGGAPGNAGDPSDIFYNLTKYAATGGSGGGTSGGNVANGHYNGGGAGGDPRGNAGSAGAFRKSESSSRNVMAGGSGGSLYPFGTGGAGAPGHQQGQERSPALENGQPGSGYGSGGGGGAGGRNDGAQGEGAAGAGGYVRFEWG